ncbi:uncharacterized protein LOC129774052 [Toxorhynchites rutilus septentrionalis]|uniref:uncharacterized protein LOC129774052 n=1 Tax=Toxorhynchites rutilus septentrionalis TaxID=329112 RepID=UPI00247A9BC3|nr:uncharacterized protein LOC129774052 [Toxorhynchites rutilus septentrionalis]
MDDTKLLNIVLLAIVCHTVSTTPISFPDGSRSGTGDTRETSSSLRQEEFEGRSIRGGYSQDKRPDYSRYSVYEHPENDYYTTRSTLRPYGSTTTVRPYSRQPNAYFNRLPPPKNDEPIEAEPEDDYDDSDDDDGDDDQGVSDVLPSKPTSGTSGDYGNYGSKPISFNNLFYNVNDKFAGFGNLFGENRRKHKFKFKRRKPGQPCIPYDLFNKLKYGRDANGNRVDPKTLINPLNLVLADINYYSPSNNYNGHGDSGSSDSGAVFNNNFYDAVGGYPCSGVNYGQKPFGHKPFGNKPHGGPLGFFGQGGLFDWTSSSASVQSDTPEGGAASPNRPTVVFNLNDAIDSVATNWRPGQSFQMVMKVLGDFIATVAGGSPVAAGEIVEDTVDTVRKVNKEFVSLFTAIASSSKVSWPALEITSADFFDPLMASFSKFPFHDIYETPSNMDVLLQNKHKPVSKSFREWSSQVQEIIDDDGPVGKSRLCKLLSMIPLGRDEKLTGRRRLVPIKLRRLLKYCRS